MTKIVNQWKSQKTALLIVSLVKAIYNNSIVTWWHTHTHTNKTLNTEYNMHYASLHPPSQKHFHLCNHFILMHYYLSNFSFHPSIYLTQASLCFFVLVHPWSRFRTRIKTCLLATLYFCIIMKWNYEQILKKVSQPEPLLQWIYQ